MLGVPGRGKLGCHLVRTRRKMSRAKDIRTTIGYEQGVAAAVTTRRHAFLRALTPEEKTDFQNQQVR